MAASGLARLLVNEGVITKSDARTLKEVSGQKPYSFARALIAIGLFDDEQLTEFVAEFGECERAPKNLVEEVDREALERIPQSLIKHLLAIPLKTEKNTMVVAIPDPLDHAVTERIRFFLGASIKPVVAPFAEIRAALYQIYGTYAEKSTGFEKFLSNFGETAVASIYRRKDPGSDAMKDLFGTNAETLEDARSGSTVSRRDDVEFSSIDEIDFGNLEAAPDPVAMDEVKRSQDSYESDAESDEFVFDEQEALDSQAVSSEKAIADQLDAGPVNFEDDAIEFSEESGEATPLPASTPAILASPNTDIEASANIEDDSLGGNLSLDDLSVEEDFEIAVSEDSSEKEMSDTVPIVEDSLSDEEAGEIKSLDSSSSDLANDLDFDSLGAEESTSEGSGHEKSDNNEPRSEVIESLSFDQALSENSELSVSELSASEDAAGSPDEIDGKNTQETQVLVGKSSPLAQASLTPTLLAKLSLINLKLSTVLDLDRAISVIDKELLGDLVQGLRLGYIDTQGFDGEIFLGKSERLEVAPKANTQEGYSLSQVPGSQLSILYFTAKDSKDDEIDCWMLLRGEIQPKAISENLQRTLRRLSRHFP